MRDRNGYFDGTMRPTKLGVDVCYTGGSHPSPTPMGVLGDQSLRVPGGEQGSISVNRIGTTLYAGSWMVGVCARLLDGDVLAGRADAVVAVSR